MSISVFDLFKVGIGPSSSHTVGPMRAAARFARELDPGLLARTTRVKAELFGSLGATGRGHGSPGAVMLGLEAEDPETVEIASMNPRTAAIRSGTPLRLAGTHAIAFDPARDLVLHKRRSMPLHPNGMLFSAFDAAGEVLASRGFYSVGGGFIVDDRQADADTLPADPVAVPHPFRSGVELLSICAAEGMPMSELMLRNECARRPADEVRERLLAIWVVMQACVQRGCREEGILPGGLELPRRAPALYRRLLAKGESALADPLSVLDWVSLYALAVNEENAAGGRVVTAPTNGAAGIIPSVLHYFMRFSPRASDEGVVRFLLTAGAIGTLYKINASISGAEVGCQGEVGSACSMAAGALAEVLGGTPAQVENAAEIAMEHNLGLTCDPINGLVQVPCIERNAMASVKAISAARMALAGDGSHLVSLDRVIETMRETGRDMHRKYKETARGGLATNVIEVPVNVIEC